MTAATDPVTEPADPVTPPGKDVIAAVDHDVPAHIREQRELAESMYRTNVVPPHLRSVEGVMAAQRAAMALRVPLWHVMQNMHLIEGRVGYDATFIRAMVRRAGHKIRVTKRTKQCAEVTIWLADEPDHPYATEYTMEDAADAELLAIDPKTKKIRKDNWRKYPKAMLVARATTLAVREVCPEVMFGKAYTPEELGADVDEDGVIIAHAERIPDRATESAVDDPREAIRERWRSRIGSCATETDLDALRDEAITERVIDRPLYPDGTTVSQAIDLRRTELAGCAADEDEIHDAEVVEDSAQDGDGDGGSPPERPGLQVVAEDDEHATDPAPVPDDPELCKDNAARRGVLAALAEGGDVDALVQVEFGLPVSQVATRRLRWLVSHVRR